MALSYPSWYGGDAPASQQAGASPAPATPKPSIVQSAAQTVGSDAKAALGWFEQNFSPKNIVNNFVSGVKGIGQQVGGVASLVGGEAKLAIDESRSKAVFASGLALNATSMPTKDGVTKAVKAIPTPNSMILEKDKQNIDAAYAKIGVNDPTESLGKKALDVTTKTFNSALTSLQLKDVVKAGISGVKGAATLLQKGAASVGGKIAEAGAETAGEAAATEEASAVAAPETAGVSEVAGQVGVAAEFLTNLYNVYSVAKDAVGAGLIKAAGSQATKVTVRTGVEAAAEDTSGEAVNVTVRGLSKEAEENATKTAGEKIINNAASTEKGSSLWTNIRSWGSSTSISDVAHATTGLRLLTNAVNMGAIGAVGNSLNAMDQGASVTTPQGRSEILNAAGVGFIDQAAVATVFGLPGSVVERVQGGKALNSLNSARNRQLVIDTNAASDAYDRGGMSEEELKSYQASVQAKYGTPITGSFGRELARNVQAVSVSARNATQLAMLQNIQEDYAQKRKSENMANLDKANSAKRAKAMGKSKTAVEQVIKGSPTVQTVSDQYAYLSDAYGVVQNPVEKSSNVNSGVKGNTITWKKGDWSDAWKQTGTWVGKQVMTVLGVSKDYAPLKDELDAVPDGSDVTGEKMTPAEKFGQIVQTYMTMTDETDRTNYYNANKTTLSLLHGVMGTPTGVSYVDGADNYLKTAFDRSTYNDIKAAAEEAAADVRTNQSTGKPVAYRNQAKYDQAIVGFSNYLHGKGGKAASEIKKAINDSYYASDLRDEAQRRIAAEKDPEKKAKYQSLFDKATTATAAAQPTSTKSAVQAKIEGLKIALKTMGDRSIPAPKDYFVQGSAKTEENPYGEAPLATKGEKVTSGKVSPSSAASQVPEEKEAPEQDKEPEAKFGKETAKLAQGVQDKAVENKLTETFGDLPEYAKINTEDQAKAANEIINSDPRYAMSIATAQEEPPQGVLPESVFVALEQKATAENDVETLQQLAKSKLTTQASVMGQRIRMLAERDPYSPTKAMNEISSERSKSFESKTGKKVDEAVKSEVTKMKKNIASPSKSSVSKFIDDITCK